MTTRSRIEWTEFTWNPVTGCTKISAGCKHCYAETMARRLKAMGAPGYERGFRLQLRPDRLVEPLDRTKPTIYFVNSMSDLFHPQVPDHYIDRVFTTMSEATWHIFQVLTKRPERMAQYLGRRRVPEHIWLGTTVENQRHGVPRISHLQKVRSDVRFLSVEPLLQDLGKIDLRGISWVIVGGESGPGARPMHPDWARNVQRQCEAADVSFFFKQWGAYGADGVRRSKKANGREFDGKFWDAMPTTLHAYA
jgi:protein gp37